MTLRNSLVIFLFGLLLGIGLSPLAGTRPQEIFKSPISVTLAETVDSSDTQGSVLGAETQDPVKLRRKAIWEALIQQDQDLGRDQQDSDYLMEDEAFEVTTKRATIAAYGDSMVDTMGTNLPYLEEALKQYYPQVQFNLLNYGIGTQNAEKGLARFTQSYQYQDRDYPPITQSGANIIVIESFAYNPMGEAGLNGQWLALSQMINQAQSTGAKVILLVTIAPTKAKFGQGPGGVNWSPDQAWQHADLIGKYLENAIGLGSSLGVPIVNAYYPSLLDNGEGVLGYISNHDHIHPSANGHQFVSSLIAKKIYSLGLIR